MYAHPAGSSHNRPENVLPLVTALILAHGPDDIPKVIEIVLLLKILAEPALVATPVQPIRHQPHRLVEFDDRLVQVADRRDKRVLSDAVGFIANCRAAYVVTATTHQAAIEQ
jgi:hypothetical protein